MVPYLAAIMKVGKNKCMIQSFFGMPINAYIPYAEKGPYYMSQRLSLYFTIVVYFGIITLTNIELFLVYLN